MYCWICRWMESAWSMSSVETRQYAATLRIRSSSGVSAAAAIMRTFLPFNVTHVLNGNKIFIMRDKKIPTDKLISYRRDGLSSDKTTSNGSGFNREQILSPVRIEQEERLCSPYSNRWYCRICIPSCMATACCVSPSSSLRCFKIFVFMRIRYLLFIA